MPPAAPFELRCWGEFALVDEHGRDRSPRGRKARAIIAWLAAHPDSPASRERLAGLLWSDRGEEQARASLRQCLYELRDLSDGTASLLTVTRDHVTLNSAALADSCDTAGTPDRPEHLRELATVIAAGEGILFGDLDGLSEGFDEWLLVERPRRRGELVRRALKAAETGLAAGEAADARELIGRLVDLDPLDETTVRLGMTADAEAGDVAALERRFQRLREALAEDLGVEPSGETRSLHRDLLRRLGQEPPASDDHALPDRAEPPPSVKLHPRSRRLRTVAAGLAAILLAVALFLLVPNPLRDAKAEPASLAVLPFHNLAAGEDYFAEGVAEEILAQLSREPELKVAGRTSSWMFKDSVAGAREVGRKLDVAYILEGSVRTAGDRVRVNVALVKTSDGIRLWSESFGGSLDDIFAIQNNIGGSVAASLKRKLVHAGTPPGPLRTSGQVYSLYLNARGLIRERTPEAMEEAQGKLRRALELDPNFAPAWSSLAQAGEHSFSPTRETHLAAIAHARKALALAPDFAEAHGVLGVTHGFNHPVGRWHIRRAAALDPNNPEFQYWLGHVYAYEANFAAMLDAFRRAFAIDPLWVRVHEYLIPAAWNAGYRSEALAYVRRIERDGSRYQGHMARAFLASARGDFSEEAKEFAAARSATDDAGKKTIAEWSLAGVSARLSVVEPSTGTWLGLGSSNELPTFATPSYVANRQWKLPSPEQLDARNRNIPHYYGDEEYVAIAAKLLINAGRADEVVALYDSDEGIMRISRRRLPGLPARPFYDGPVVAAALRAAGREAEADRILAHLDRSIAMAWHRNDGRLPYTFLAEAAQTWAMRGKHDAALSALERAMRGGWAYVAGYGDSSLPDIGDEPAFRSLRGNPRFERVRARLNAHLARERRELRAIAI